MSTLAMSDYVLGQSTAGSRSGRFVIWIDRVGAWLVCLGSDTTIGGPTGDANSADVALLANLSRRHVTLSRSGERYVLHAHSPAFVAGRAVHDRADLCDGYELQLGASVRLKFCLPSVMSGSARLEFVSDHRPARAADGVVLMDDTCLIGAGAGDHIPCPSWPQSVLLVRRGDKLYCKSREELFFDGRLAPASGELPFDTVVTGNEIRFRVEAVE